MQVIIPYPEDLVKSSQFFNKRQLGKQIDDICKIMMIYINSEMGVAIVKFNKKHLNILSHYFTRAGISYLLYYGILLCEEYKLKTKSEHQGLFSIYGFTHWFDIFYDGDFPISIRDNKEFKPIYVNNNGENPNTEKVGELYRKLLGVEE